MTGCGSRQQVEASDSIELLEPVSAAANTEAAAYRNIYEYKVLAGTVYPYIREYSFTQDVVLTKYEKAPGDRISKGDLLISADISSIEQQIKVWYCKQNVTDSLSKIGTSSTLKTLKKP